MPAKRFAVNFACFAILAVSASSLCGDNEYPLSFVERPLTLPRFILMNNPPNLPLGFQSPGVILPGVIPIGSLLPGPPPQSSLFGNILPGLGDCDATPNSGIFLVTGTALNIQDPHPPFPSGEIRLFASPDNSVQFFGQDPFIPTNLIPGTDGTLGGTANGSIFGGAVPTNEIIGSGMFIGSPTAIPTFVFNFTLSGDPADGHFINTYTDSGPQTNSYSTNSCTFAFHTPDPVSTATGELSAGYNPDLSLGGPLPLAFRRYYASYLSVNGVASALGTNWMHNFDEKLVIAGNTATVSLLGGGAVRFKQSGGGFTISSLGRLPYQLVSAANGYRFLNPATNLISTYSSAGALTKIEDRNANGLTVTQSSSGPMQVSDGLGRSVSFVYTSGKLAKVQDQSGRSVSFTNTGGNLTAFTDANGNTTSFAYTSAGGISGLMTSSTKPGGNNPYTQMYDGKARVSQQTDGMGNKTTLAYNANGTPGLTMLTDALAHNIRQVYQNLRDLSGFTDASGQSGSISYDTLGRPVSFTDRLGNKTTLAYDKASGYPASITDSMGNTTTFTYTSQSQGGFTFYNLTKIAYPDGTSASFTFDGSGNVLTVTDRAGKKTVDTYNTRGQVLTETNPAGGVTMYLYNSDGTLASTKSAAGNSTSITYDDKKRPSKVQNPDNTTQSVNLDALDQVTAITDEFGKTTKFAYDPNLNPKSITDPLGQSAGLAYDSRDLLASVTDPLGKITRFQYDALGSITAITNQAGEKTSFTYDAQQRLKSAADPSGKGPSFSYDADGRLLAATDAVSNTTKFTVDKLGRTTRITTPLNENFDLSYDAVSRVTSTMNPLSQKTIFAYDNRDLVSSATLPGGISGSYAYGDLPVLNSITDPNGNNSTLIHDTLGRLVSSTDSLGQMTSYGYDSRDRVSAITHPLGTAQITYDAAGNQVQRQYSDGTSLTFTYDDDSRLTGGTGISLAFDAAGRMSNSNGLTISRDAAGRISAVGYAPGPVSYSYDTRGLPVTISDWAGGTTNLAYDDARRLISITRPNGMVTQYTYDKNGRIAGITETAGGNTLASLAVQRDAAGKTTSADRNVPQAPNPAPGMLPLAYDAANQISGLSYDPLGRLNNDGLRSYTFDLASRLTSYSGADGMASFTYDALGQRVSRTGADGTTLGYVWNNAFALPAVAVLQASGADVRYYVGLPDGSLLYSIEAADNSRHFFHFDETGSTTFLTDDNGSITDSYGITPYGETVTAGPSNATDNPFTWQGRWGVMQEPGTSLFYLRNRYYDANSARFLSRDPVLNLNPLAMDPYQYAFGNPLSFNDPTGRVAAQIPGAIYMVPPVINTFGPPLGIYLPGGPNPTFGPGPIFAPSFGTGTELVGMGPTQSNSDNYVTLYTAISLNYRFLATASVHTYEEEEDRTNPRPKRRCKPRPPTDFEPAPFPAACSPESVD